MVTWMLKVGFHVSIVEINCLQVFQKIMTLVEVLNKLDVVLNDVKINLRDIILFQTCHVGRSANSTARILTKLGFKDCSF